MNHTLRVKVDENAPHYVVGVLAIVVDASGAGQEDEEEEEANHYRVYYHKENVVEEAAVGYGRGIAHVSLASGYSCKQHLHKAIAVLVDDVVVVADAAVAVVVVAVEEQMDGDAAAVAAAVDGNAAVAHKGE